MTKLPMFLGAAAATMILAACADDEYAYGPAYGPAYGAVDAAYAGPYGVWYDGYYGPYYGGSWDGDVFVWRDSDGRLHRDFDGHFRHARFENGRGYPLR